MIQFASTNFDFGKAVSGEIVKHDFWFTNTGAADLVLSNAYAHCGCSKVIEWTRLVKPGGAGMVSAQFDTALYNSPASKLYTVECNDRRQPVVSLWVTGTVAKMFDVIPIAAYIELQAESPFGRGEARITNYTDQPLFLSDPHCTNRLFGAELKTNVLGKDYLVVVSNTAAMAVPRRRPRFPSIPRSPICRSSHLAMANMKALVEVTTGWITLPPPPIPTNQWSRFVVVVNNSTNPLTLSDPVASSKDVGVSVRALDPGQRYSITLTFPPDFRSGRRPIRVLHRQDQQLVAP